MWWHKLVRCMPCYRAVFKKNTKGLKTVGKIMNQETSGKGSENSWLVTQKVSTLAKGHVLFRAKVVHEVQ